MKISVFDPSRYVSYEKSASFYCCILILRHLFDFLSETYNFVSILFFIIPNPFWYSEDGYLGLQVLFPFLPKSYSHLNHFVYSKLSICFPLVKGTAISKNEVSIFYDHIDHFQNLMKAVNYLLKYMHI